MLLIIFVVINGKLQTQRLIAFDQDWPVCWANETLFIIYFAGCVPPPFLQKLRVAYMVSHPPFYSCNFMSTTNECSVTHNSVHKFTTCSPVMMMMQLVTILQFCNTFVPFWHEQAAS